MRPEFEKYCRELGMGDAMVGVVRRLHDECQSLAPDPLERVAISETVNRDGMRNYETLHFLSAHMLFEIQTFTTAPEILAMGLDGHMAYCMIKRKNFDMEAPTPDSRAEVRVRWPTLGMQIILKASADNCKHCLDIVKERFLSAIAYTAGK